MSRNSILFETAAPSLAFGAWQDRAAGQTYCAATDGFVSAGVLPSRDTGDFCFGVLTGRVGDRVVACATFGNFGSFDGAWNAVRASGACSFLMPVAKGSRWEVALIEHPGSQNAPGPFVLWMPQGGETESAPGHNDNYDEVAPGAEFRPWQDFEPALLNLTSVLERIIGRTLSDSDRLDLLRAIRQLI